MLVCDDECVADISATMVTNSFLQISNHYGTVDLSLKFNFEMNMVLYTCYRHA